MADEHTRRRRRRGAFCAVVALLLTVAACTQTPGAPTTSPRQSAAPALASPSSAPAVPSPSGGTRYGGNY